MNTKMLDAAQAVQDKDYTNFQKAINSSMTERIAERIVEKMKEKTNDE